MVVFQLLFRRLDFKARIERCFKHIDPHYRHDLMATRVCGLSVLPDTSTVSLNLEDADADSVVSLRKLLRKMCILRIGADALARITVDFDGSVQSTKGHAEGVAVGFNRSA